MILSTFFKSHSISTKKLIVLLSYLFYLSQIGFAQMVSTFAGSGSIGSVNATGLAASFYYPTGVCADASGNIVVADQYNHKIRKISPSGVVTTFAGSGAPGATDATSLAASFNRPYSLCMDAAGNIYVGELFNYKIRKITPAGIVTTFAGSGTSGATDATGIAASFNYPNGLCLDASGNMFVADYFNNTVRKITPLGVVTTFAGSGTAGAIDALGLAASFNGPSGICIDASGNLYVSDFVNNKIRKITPAGMVSIFAGSGAVGSLDATGIGASFNGPGGICSDVSGNLYVSDTYNHKIRQISPAGVVTTLAGTGMAGAIDATVSLASFDHPIGVYKDATSNLFIGDPYNHKIRKIGNCVAPGSATNTSSNANTQICVGNSTTLTAVGSGSINWYTSSTGGVTVNTGTTLLISNTLTAGTYTYYAEVLTCTSSLTRTAITLTINPLPLIAMNSGSICYGQSFTLTPIGASSYSFSSGSSIVSPSTNTSYSVTGTNSFGCSNFAVSTITVLPLPIISVNSGSICSGQTFTLNPSGGVSYSYSAGSSTVTPSVNTSYSVTGIDASGCLGSAVSNITVNALPTLTTLSSSTLLCAGESSTLIISGAVNYTWSNGYSGNSISVSPTITSTYSIVGTDLYGCTNTASLTQPVSSCNGFSELQNTTAENITIYPNPSHGEFMLEFINSISQYIEIVDIYGRILRSYECNTPKLNINLTDFSNGIYFARIYSVFETENIKLIKQ